MNLDHKPKGLLLEHEIQKRFISHITGETEISGGNENRLHLYRDLVQYRFREVLQNSFPVFAQKIGNELFQRLIAEFILTKPSTPYIWQMPDEFRNFVIGKNMRDDFPYVEDLLWYEWIEVELFMKNYRKTELVPFTWEKQWIIHESANLRKMVYGIHLGEFETLGNFPIVLYYDFLDNEVHFHEVTPFLVHFFSLCSRFSAKEALQKVSSEFKLDYKDVKPVLTPTLEDFAIKQIIRQGD
ncbi:MAG: DNA-binding domain-containing protein [Leptospirales bacterium]